jgi:hypothetical protein
MPNEHHKDARRTMGDKLERMVGKRGEYPPDRAVRIAGPVQTGGQGDACQWTPEQFNGAPNRQISNYGRIKGG